MIRQKPLRILFLMIGVLLPVLLASCEKDDEPILSYQINQYTIPSLHQVLGEDVGVLDSYEIPEEPDAKDTATPTDESKGVPGDIPSQDSETVSPPQQVYQYSALPKGGLDIQTYAEALMSTPDLDLHPINAAGRSVSLPDYSTEEGFVLLSMAELESETMLRVLISWAGTSCIVRVSIVDAPRPSQGDAVTASTAIDGNLTAQDTVSYFQNLSPATLGLDGDSMEIYEVYYLAGKVLINGEPCSRVQIYVTSPPEGSNAYVGTFLISGSQSHLYRLDLQTEEVIELTRP